MIGQSGNVKRPATLDDLAALNREIAALVRAGLPLEEGLRQIADDMKGGAGRIAARLEQEVASGKSLDEAVAAQGAALPPTYRSVVAAGLQAGRLPAALEGFADAAARVSDLRRIAAQAAAYPLAVFILGWILLLAVASLALPRYEWLGIDERFWARPLTSSSGAAWGWAAAVTAAALVLCGLWWLRTASSYAALDRWSWARWIPGAGRAIRLAGQASFAQMLALLLACRAPLGEALELAGEASGLSSLSRAAAALRHHLAAGRPLAAELTAMRALPPLVRTALLTSPSPEALQQSLSRAAESYRDRASAWTAQVAVVVPITATLAFGGVVAATYAYLMLQPYIATLQEIASWP
jgi:general secretion pathway protein F